MRRLVELYAERGPLLANVLMLDHVLRTSGGHRADVATPAPDTCAEAASGLGRRVTFGIAARGGSDYACRGVRAPREGAGRPSMM